MNITSIAVLGGLYGAAILSTFGYFLRNGRDGVKRRALQVVASAGWPIYWLTFHNPAALFNTFVDAFLFSEQFKTIYWSFGILFIPFYIYGAWDACTGAWCSLVITKAVIWAPFWPAYWLASSLTN
jgi:hypothetical protein